jgi:hypothetical protein
MKRVTKQSGLALSNRKVFWKGCPRILWEIQADDDGRILYSHKDV